MTDETPAEQVKAALTGESGVGANFLPVTTANEIIRIVRDRTWLPGVFRQISMKTEIMKIPRMTAEFEFKKRDKVAGETEETGQTYGTDEMTLTMQTVIAMIPIGNRVVAYGIDALLPVIKDGIAEKLAETEEDMVINGDVETGSSYADNINGAYNDPNNPAGVDATHNTRLLNWDGLRAINFRAVAATTITNVNASGAALSETHLTSAFYGLGKLGINRANLLIFVPTLVGTKMLTWDSVKTQEKYGPKATIHVGELGKIFGATIIETAHIPVNLNATGKWDGSVKDRTVVLIVNKNMPVVGTPAKMERKFQVKVEDKPAADLFRLIPQEDMAFNAMRDEGVIQITNIKY